MVRNFNGKFKMNRRLNLLNSLWIRSLVQSWLMIALAGRVVAQQTDFVDVQNALLKAIEATKIAAEVAGRVSKMEVSEGTRIENGQELARIHDAAVRLQWNRAKIATNIARFKHKSNVNLQLAEKRSEVAKNELDRAKLANSRVADTYPLKEIERLQLVYESAMLEIDRAREETQLQSLDVEVAENEQKAAEELIARHRILAPVSGTIVSVSKRPGEWVEPGAEMLQIVSLERLRIEGFINAEAISHNLVDQDAELTLVGVEDTGPLPCKVVFVNPDVNPVNNQARIYLEVANVQGKLLPGMRVQAKIRVAKP
jgi:multidrug resistance efflux pump